jgi:hypothetical protein
MKLSFRYGAFSIEGMVEEKMVSISFGGAAGYVSGHLALRLPGWLRQPKRHMAPGQTRAPHGAWAALPLLRPDPSVTGAWVLAKDLIVFGRPEVGPGGVHAQPQGGLGYVHAQLGAPSHAHTQVGSGWSMPILKLGLDACLPKPERPRPTQRWARRRPCLTPSWVWTRPHPTTCVNIIMCFISIIFSLIIQSVHIKNNIICVINIIICIITQSIDIKILLFVL